MPRSVRAALLLLVAATALTATAAPAWARQPTRPAAPPQAHAAARPPVVHRVRAAWSGATRIRLTWTDAPHTVRTVVRAARGDAAPRGPRSGIAVGAVRVPGHSVTAVRLRPGSEYSFSLFAEDARGRASRPVVVRARTAPAGVTRLAAFDLGHGAVAVQWRDPSTPSLSGVTVRWQRGASAPAHPWTGRPAAVHDSTATLTGLPRNARFSVAVWAHDSANRYSWPAVTRFTTGGAPVPTGTLSGLVTDTAGHPLAGVQLSATAWVSGASYAAVTDAAGRYTMIAPPDRYQLAADGSAARGGDADATGYQPYQVIVTVRAGRRTVAGARLARGAALSGRVTDDAGHPLAGVEPYAMPELPYVQPTVATSLLVSMTLVSSAAVTVTAADGTYTLRGLPAAAMQVCFGTDNGNVTGGGHDAVGYAARCSQHSVAAAVGSTRPLGDAALAADPGQTVAGRITARSGAPLADALVVLAQTGSYGGLAEATFTGPDGSFRMHGVPAGSYRLCAGDAGIPGSATGYAPRCLAEPVHAAGGIPATVDLTLLPGAAVRGTVTGPSGGPLAGVQVYVGASADSPDNMAVTDANGRYEVRSLTSGPQLACFDTSTVVPTRADPTGAASACAPGRFRVQAGLVRTGIDRRLGRAGGLTGRVLDPAGRPVPYADVIALSAAPDAWGMSWQALAEADGRYTVPGLAAGAYYLCAQPVTTAQPDCPERTRAVRVGALTRGADIRLARTAAVTVQVRDADGHPVTGVDAAVLERCTDPFSCNTYPVFGPARVDVAASDVTGAGGTVTLSGLQAGRYAVCLFAYYGTTTADPPATGFADRCTGTGFGVALVVGRRLTVRQTVSAGGGVTGRVTDADGHPLRGVVVHVPGSAADDYPVSYLGDDPQAGSVTGADGRFTVTSVRAGTVRVCLDAGSAAGGSSRGGYVTRCLPGTVVRSGATAMLGDLALTGAGVITGTLRSRAGTAIPGSAVMLYRGRTPVARATPGGAGGYRLDHVPAGSYRVCFFGYGYGTRCWRDVAWPLGRARPPAAATPVVVPAGAAVGGVDGRLIRG